MAFVDRVVEHPGRVRLTQVSGETDVFDMTREEGAVTEEGTPLNASNLNSEIANVVGDQLESTLSALSIDNNLNVHVRNIQSGTITISCTGGTPTGVSVSFPNAFTAAPFVVVTPQTKYPQSIFATAVSVTTTGFQLWGYRPTDGSLTVHWIAMR